jgi:hypothetical protein
VNAAPRAHERYDELAAGYALDALEPADEQLFLSHLATCADCQRAVAEHTETLGHLAYAAEPAELPLGLLDGIRAGMAASGRPPAVQPAQPAEPAQPAQPAPLDLAAARTRRRSTPPGRWLISMAAAAALVLSLGVWNVALHRDRSASDQRADQLAAAVRALEGPATHRIDLKGPDGRAIAVAMVRGDGTVALVVDGLARNDRSSSTYVLWQQSAADRMLPVGAFDVTGDGVQVVSDLRTVVNAGLKGLAVTREPGRTAPAAPSTAPIAAGFTAA